MNDPFSECKSYAFRVEGLPHYDVPGTDQKLSLFERFGTADPALNMEWIETVRACRARGARVLRLRLISDPLSRYEAFELGAGYAPAIAAGEEVRIVPRTAVPPVTDFWSFDGVVIRRMNYSATGAFVGSDVGEMSTEERESERVWLEIFSHAQRLE